MSASKGKRSPIPIILTHWWQILLGLILTTWAVYQVIAGVRGIYLATIPEVHHLGESVSLPFSVKNKSDWFSIKKIVAVCIVKSMRDKQNREFGTSVTSLLQSEVTINPGDSPLNFNCNWTPIDSQNVSFASINVFVYYTSSFRGYDLWENSVRLPITWVGSQWIEGPLNN